MGNKTAHFEKAVKKLLALEGGYRNDPQDPGGETKYGISKKTYPDLDIVNLTRDEAIEIYLNDWWEKHGYGRIDDARIAAKCLSLSVNMGPGPGHVLLQTAVIFSGGLQAINIDGIIGPETIGAINSHPNPDYLLARYKLLAIRHYNGIGNRTYLRGWITRVLA